MLPKAAVRLGMTVALMALIIIGMQVETAPSERFRETAAVPGFGKPSDSLQVPSRASAIPPKLSRLHFSQNIKPYPLGTAGLDRTKSTAKMTTRTMTAGTRTERSQVHTDTAGPDKWTKIQKMILALEELHKTFNSTLSSQLTIISRANGRNPARKIKMPKLPPAEEGVKQIPTTTSTANSTNSRASSGGLHPSLTGQNARKSLSPQNKKSNKRVCFWKYCSQN